MAVSRASVSIGSEQVLDTKERVRNLRRHGEMVYSCSDVMIDSDKTSIQGLQAMVTIN